MRLIAIIALILAAGCSQEYRLAHDERHCDGEDDDRDGTIDDGFWDADDDGVADCMDRTCEVTDVAPEAFAGSATCGREDPQVANPWSIELEISATSEIVALTTTPVVGALRDTTGDGRVDRRDRPDVVIAGSFADAPGQVVVFSSGGQVVWSRERSWFYNQRPLLADVTGDALPDVLTIERDAGRLRVVALDGAGDEQWASDWSSLKPSPYALSVTAADLDGDGIIEVLGLDLILDGRTGETKAVLDLGGERAPELEPIAADLDGDGVLEVFTGGRIYALDGSLVWDVGGRPMEASGGAWLQADDDEALELFVAESHEWRLVDDSGFTQVSDTLPIGTYDDIVPRPPCVADFDGDGRDEVVFAWSGAWSLFDPDDGEVAWASEPMVSWWPYTCTAVDLDVDGAFEIVAPGVDAGSVPFLLILDGATGAVLAEKPSEILIGQVVVADVDLDGSAEIVAAGATTTNPAGLEVWGHPEGGWPTTTANWSGHDHSDVNVDEDGTVISRPDPPMGRAGVFRGHLSGWGPGVDLAVDITDTCVATCDLDDGLVRVGTAVSNLGAGHAASAISVALYADAPDGRVLLDRQPLASAPQAGTRAPGPTLTAELADTRGRELVVVVDVDGAQPECDEANNEARVTIDACPP